MGSLKVSKGESFELRPEGGVGVAQGDVEEEEHCRPRKSIAGSWSHREGWLGHSPELVRV